MTISYDACFRWSRLIKLFDSDASFKIPCQFCLSSQNILGLHITLVICAKEKEKIISSTCHFLIGTIITGIKWLSSQLYNDNTELLRMSIIAKQRSLRSSFSHPRMRASQLILQEHRNLKISFTSRKELVRCAGPILSVDILFLLERRRRDCFQLRDLLYTDSRGDTPPLQAHDSRESIWSL